jgi:hypothetical protein
MFDKLLIAQEDILVVRPTAELDNARLEPFIKEAQTFDLLPVLSEPLMIDLLEEYDGEDAELVEIYGKLLNGEIYTVEGDKKYFPGVKQYLSYCTLVRFVESNPINIVRFGIKVESEGSDAAIRVFTNILKSNAQAIKLKTIEYLKDNSTTFEKYAGTSSNIKNNSSLNFFKVNGYRN